jgi:hypothetical protein
MYLVTLARRTLLDIIFTFLCFFLFCILLFSDFTRSKTTHTSESSDGSTTGTGCGLSSLPRPRWAIL